MLFIPSSSLLPLLLYIGDAYSRARWNKFREDVSGLGERVAGVERNVQSLDKRQREADSKAKDREKEITELQSLRLENSRLKVRRVKFSAKLSMSLRSYDCPSVCPSVPLSIGPSVHRSICPSVQSVT